MHNAFFPHKSPVSGDEYRIAFTPACRVKLGALEELEFAAETLLPPGSMFSMQLHGDELVVALKVEAHPNELQRLTEKLSHAAALNGIFLTPSGQRTRPTMGLSL